MHLAVPGPSTYCKREFRGQHYRVPYAKNAEGELSPSETSTITRGGRGENGEQMNRAEENQDALFADPEEVVAFAQAYYSTEYTNNERGDCLPGESLRAFVRSGALPDAQLRAHLFKCPKCFRLYRSVRVSQRPSEAVREPWWQPLRNAVASVTAHPAFAIAGVMCLVLAGTFGALIWRAVDETPELAKHIPPQEGSATKAAPQYDGVGISPSPDGRKVTPPEKSVNARPEVRPHGDNKGKRVAREASPRVIEINLGEESLLRDVETAGSAQRVITLPPERQRLRFRLPEGSPRGRYSVSIIDVFGKSEAAATANSDGRSLTVDLDLSGLTSKKYRLGVGRVGEAPDYYLISMGNRMNREVK